jgi:hypothetical protein
MIRIKQITLKIIGIFDMQVMKNKNITKEQKKAMGRDDYL